MKNGFLDLELLTLTTYSVPKVVHGSIVKGSSVFLDSYPTAPSIFHKKAMRK
jgi:hypothetical protein